MKKMISLFACMTLLLATFIVPTYSVSEEIAPHAYVIGSSVICSRSSSEFVAGAEYYMIFEVVYVYGTIITTTNEIVNYVGEYLNVTGAAEQVEALRATSELTANAIVGMDFINELEYPNAERLGNASAHYNCHSYAWHESSTNNLYWINSPNNYYSNNSRYVQVSTPVVGDIICYFDGETNLHSGIVSYVYSDPASDYCGSSVKVISKWGHYGLYEHNGYECPYTSYGGGTATDVKYFHEHRFTYSRNLTNLSVHTVTCSTCNYSFVDNHTYKSLPNGTARCTKCGHISMGPIIMSEIPEPITQ